MDSKQAHAVVDAWHSAYNSQDVAGLCDLAHPSIEITPMQPLMQQFPGTAFRGHEGIRSLSAWTYGNFPRIHADTLSVRGLPGWTMAVTNYTYDADEPDSTRVVWSLFDIDGDRIRRIRGFASEADAKDAAGRLTRREREIYELMARGLNANEIAEMLVLSPYTVRKHMQNARERLGARTTAHAVSIAVKRGDIVP